MWPPVGYRRVLYGESNAAGAGISAENFPHLRIGVAGKAKGEPGEVGHELVVGLGIHPFLDDAHASRDLGLEMLDPFLGEVGHASGSGDDELKSDGMVGRAPAGFSWVGSRSFPAKSRPHR